MKSADPWRCLKDVFPLFNSIITRPKQGKVILSMDDDKWIVSAVKQLCETEGEKLV